MQTRTYIKYRQQLKDVTSFVRASSVELLSDVVTLQDKYESGERLTHADFLLLTKRAKDLQKVGKARYE
jgi:uncharacterized coiled-coil DUF342 family protein